MQKPSSIGDQLRKCFEHASKIGLKVDPLHVYFDEEISGTDRIVLQ